MMTKKEAVSNFRMMWHRMAERTRKEKRCVSKHEVIRELWGDVDLKRECWCCEYDRQFKGDCRHCTVKWSCESDADIWCMDSEYGSWDDACDIDYWEKAAKWADIIAELPEREDV